MSVVVARSVSVLPEESWSVHLIGVADPKLTFPEKVGAGTVPAVAIGDRKPVNV